MSAAVCLLASLLSCPYPYLEARLQLSNEYTQSIKRDRLAMKSERLGKPATPIAARFGPDEQSSTSDIQIPVPVVFSKLDQDQDPQSPGPSDKKPKIKASSADEPRQKLKTRTRIILETRRSKTVETAYGESSPIEEQWHVSSLFGIRNAAPLSQSISKVSDIDTGKSGYQEVIRAAKIHQVPVDLALRVAKQESSGDCGARSSAGALGVMQVMPKTGAKHGYSTRQLTDCRSGAEAGVKELKHLLQLAGGDVKQTLTGYNCGEDCMFGRRKKLPLETVNYIQAITRN